MASARARLGKARRSMIGRQKRSNVFQGILSTVGTVATFAAGQAKKAETAWGEYEAGYKELGGEGFERPKFGQKGYFKGPEGEVSIGRGRHKKIYDAGQIQKAGSFLGSDAAAILDPEQRQQYLGRTAPGREAFVPRAPSSPPDYSKIQAGVAQYEKTAADRLKMETELAGWEAHDVARKKLDIDIRRDEQAQVLQDYRIGSEGQQKTAWVDYMANPPALSQKMLGQVEKGHEAYSEEWLGEPFYARGGDFITNGPQKILVGDNPGGRERVTIRPLPSSNDRSSSENRSLLESLYENNRRRKKY